MGLCKEFHCLPSQLLAEDVSFLQMVKMVRIAAGARGEVSNVDSQ